MALSLDTQSAAIMHTRDGVTSRSVPLAAIMAASAFQNGPKPGWIGALLVRRYFKREA